VTFAILGVDPANGLLGVAQTTAPIAVGSRCPRVLPGVGVAVSQGNTQPGLSYVMLDALQQGASADEALQRALRSDPFPQMRQLAVMRPDGTSAAHSGTALNAFAGHHVEAGLAIIGNGLTGADVVSAIIDMWRAKASSELEDRLASALAAGRDAGGDRNGHASAVLLVADTDQRWPRTDLRVDWSPRSENSGDAVDALLNLTRQYVPMIPYYAARARDPMTPDFETWRSTDRHQSGQGAMSSQPPPKRQGDVGGI
jgi:uncharacterized Ntn-hydrolase superfamily protein